MIKLRPSTLRQLREECDYAFFYHRDSAGRPAVTHCILYNRADSIYCRGFAILSPLDIKLGQVRKKRGEMVALGRAWKALQTGVSFGPVGRWHVEDLLTDLANPLDGAPRNPVLEMLTITTEDFQKAQYDVTPLYEEHEALETHNSRKKVPGPDWIGTDPATKLPHLRRPEQQLRPMEIDEINRTLRAIETT